MENNWIFEIIAVITLKWFCNYVLCFVSLLIFLSMNHFASRYRFSLIANRETSSGRNLGSLGTPSNQTFYFLLNSYSSSPNLPLTLLLTAISC